MLVFRLKVQHRMNVTSLIFCLKLNQRRLKKHSRIQIGLLPCKKNSIILKDRKFGNWYPGQRISQ